MQKLIFSSPFQHREKSGPRTTQNLFVEICCAEILYHAFTMVS